MKRLTQRDAVEISDILSRGGIGVLKTDTLYGIVASARSRAAVERVYRVRGRAPSKPCIVLLSDEQQLLVSPPTFAKTVLASSWPGPVSIILPVDESVPEWLHRGTRTLAYRVPADEELRRLLEATGPLIAPSANPEAEPPARSISEAEHYFGKNVDFYVDSGIQPPDTPPSRLLRIYADGTTETLR